MKKTIALGLVAASTLGFASVASADEPAGQRMPVAFAQRPLTLPSATLAPELDFQVAHVSLFGQSADAVGLSIGGAVGVSDDFTIRATVAPLILSPKVQYGSPVIGATYRFLKGDFEIGGSLDVALGFVNSDNPIKAQIQPGIPMRAHIAKVARIDTGVFVPVLLVEQQSLSPSGASSSSDMKPHVGMSIPVAVNVDVAEPVHVGVQTGFTTLFDDFGKNATIPLTFNAGFAIPGNTGPLVDIQPFFSFPGFLTPGAEGDAVHTNLWTAGVNLTGYLYL